MADLLVLAGIALCLLSVVLAVVQLLRTEPPRGAALAFVAGLAMLLAGAVLNPEPFSPAQIPAALDRVIGGATAS